MGQVISFSEADEYLKDLASRGEPLQAILDTNILIAVSYEIKDSREQSVELLKRMEHQGVEFFATITTKAEFMEFHRRLMLTETLIDLIDEHSKLKVPKSAVEQIRKATASVRSKQARDNSDPIFNDRQIKEIKQEFSAGSHSGHLGWLKICETYLKGYIREVESELDARGIRYLSPNDKDQKNLFVRELEWPIAAALIERTGISVSDALILNALNCSTCQFAVSQDFDFEFAVLADQDSKDVLMPDEMAGSYRHYHFGRQN